MEVALGLSPSLRCRLLEDLDFDDHQLGLLKDEIAAITLPTRHYGFASSKFTWDQLKQIIQAEQDLAKLCRSEDQQREYEIFRLCLQRKYQSVLDFLLISKFGFEKRRNCDEECWRAYPSLRDYSETRTVLVANDFPYYMDDGIVHYILWKTKEPISFEDIAGAKEQLSRRMELIDTLHWINPPHLQSLPDIDHVHILCRLN